MPWTTLCEKGELAEGQGKYVEIDGFRLAVFLHNGMVFTMDNACPHAGGSMASGWIDGDCVLCPWHAWAFRLDTGELSGGSGFRIETYATRVHTRGDGAELVQADLPMP